MGSSRRNRKGNKKQSRSRSRQRGGANFLQNALTSVQEGAKKLISSATTPPEPRPEDAAATDGSALNSSVDALIAKNEGDSAAQGATSQSAEGSANESEGKEETGTAETQDKTQDEGTGFGLGNFFGLGTKSKKETLSDNVKNVVAMLNNLSETLVDTRDHTLADINQLQNAIQNVQSKMNGLPMNAMPSEPMNVMPSEPMNVMPSEPMNAMPSEVTSPDLFGASSPEPPKDSTSDSSDFNSDFSSDSSALSATPSTELSDLSALGSPPTSPSLDLGPTSPSSLDLGPTSRSSLDLGPTSPSSLDLGPTSPSSLDLGPTSPSLDSSLTAPNFAASPPSSEISGLNSPQDRLNLNGLDTTQRAGRKRRNKRTRRRRRRSQRL